MGVERGCKMTNRELQIIKKEILHYLCDDWNNGKRGKAHSENQALFDRNKGFACFNGTNLEMVMDAVVKGLKSAQEKINRT